MDLLALDQPRGTAPLDQMAKLMGLPGKLGMGGGAVWDTCQAGGIAAIRDYCETDVMNTYLVYLRFQKMRSALSASEHKAEVVLVRRCLAELGQAHWHEFLAAWPF